MNPFWRFAPPGYKLRSQIEDLKRRRNIFVPGFGEEELPVEPQDLEAERRGFPVAPRQEPPAESFTPAGIAAFRGGGPPGTPKPFEIPTPQVASTPSVMPPFISAEVEKVKRLGFLGALSASVPQNPYESMRFFAGPEEDPAALRATRLLTAGIGELGTVGKPFTAGGKGKISASVQRWVNMDNTLPVAKSLDKIEKAGLLELVEGHSSPGGFQPFLVKVKDPETGKSIFLTRPSSIKSFAEKYGREGVTEVAPPAEAMPSPVAKGIGKPKIGDIVTDKNNLIRAEVLAEGTLGKKNIPGYRIRILTGHEKGVESFISADNIGTITKPKVAAEVRPPVAEAPAVAPTVPVAKPRQSYAEKYRAGLKAKSVFEGGEVLPTDGYAWRSMGPKEFERATTLGMPAGPEGKGRYWSWYPEYSSNLEGLPGKPKYLVEVKGKTSSEALVRDARPAEITGIWKSEGKGWVKQPIPSPAELPVTRVMPEAVAPKAAEAVAPGAPIKKYFTLKKAQDEVRIISKNLTDAQLQQHIVKLRDFKGYIDHSDMPRLIEGGYYAGVVDPSATGLVPKDNFLQTNLGQALDEAIKERSSRPSMTAIPKAEAVAPGAESAATKVAFEAAPTPEVGGVPAGQARAPQVAEVAPPVKPPPTTAGAVPPVQPTTPGAVPPVGQNPLTPPSPGRQPIKVPEVRSADEILEGVRETYPRRVEAKTPQAITLKESRQLQTNAEEVGRNSQSFLLARLTETGTPEELFGIQRGQVTKVGNPNNLSTAWGDVYENYTKYTLNDKQRQLIENFHGIEDGLKAEAARHGVDISELTSLDAMWHYAARKVTGKGVPKADRIVRVSGKSLGTKESFQKQRVFEFMQDGLDKGFTYADPSETMQSIIAGYYRLIGDKMALERVKGLGKTLKPGERIPYGELRSRQPGLFGYKFPKEIAREIDDLFTPEVVNKWANLGVKITSPFIPLKASLDASWFAIQGALPIAHSIFVGKPQVAGRTIIGATKALVNPKSMDVFRRNHEATYLEALPHNLITGTTEFFEALGPLGKAAGKVPIIGRGLARGIKETYGRASAMFDAASEEYRIIGWETYKDAWLKSEGTLDQLGDFLNIMSGVMSSKLAGVSATRQALERIPAFAPRFYRANFMVLGHLFDGTKTAREVQKGLGGLFAMAYLQHITTSLAANQPLKLDPRPKSLGGNGGEWLTNEVEGQNVGFGGFMLGLARLMATVGAVAVDDPRRMVSLDGRVNPVLNWVRGKASPPVGFINEMARGEDFMGNELRGVNDYLTQALSLGIPITAESILFDEPRPGPVASAITALGGRVFPVDPKDAMARSMFGGKDYRELDPAELRDLRQTPGWAMFVEEAKMPAAIRQREQGQLDFRNRLTQNSTYLGEWTGRAWSNAQMPDPANPGKMVPYSVRDWRADLRDMYTRRATEQATRERLLGPMRRRKPRDEKEEVLWDYYKKADEYTEKDKAGKPIPGGKILNMDGFIQAQDEYLAGLTPELEKHVLDNLGIHDDKRALEFRADKRVIKFYWEALTLHKKENALLDEQTQKFYILVAQRRPVEAQSMLVAYPIVKYINQRAYLERELRKRHPDIDRLLVKWGYETRPASPQVAQEMGLRVLEPSFRTAAELLAGAR